MDYRSPHHVPYYNSAAQGLIKLDNDKKARGTMISYTKRTIMEMDNVLKGISANADNKLKN